MEEWFDILQEQPLFAGIARKEYAALLNCVGARVQRFGKEEFISLVGDEIRSLGVVLQGWVHILKEDVFGNRAVLNDLGQGEMFGESFICGGRASLTVSIQAATPCQVLFLSFDRVLHACTNACEFHNTLIKNMVVMIARKNLALVEKLEVTTKHFLREKVLTYLSQLAQQQNSTTVLSPLGRVDLAGFLGVDRSALTRELNRMQREGLIEFEKDSYRLPGARLP